MGMHDQIIQSIDQSSQNYSSSLSLSTPNYDPSRCYLTVICDSGCILLIISNRSLRLKATQPAVPEQFYLAICMKIAQPRPGITGLSFHPITRKQSQRLSCLHRFSWLILVSKVRKSTYLLQSGLEGSSHQPSYSFIIFTGKPIIFTRVCYIAVVRSNLMQIYRSANVPTGVLPSPYFLKEVVPFLPTLHR